MLKPEWRSRLQSLGLQQKSSYSLKIVNHLEMHLSSRQGIWAAFQSLPGEPDLSALYQKNLSGIDWCFPVVVGQDLHFKKASGFQKGAFGILEPDAAATAVAKSEIRGILVPGVGMDLRGTRLGRGKGFYDRFLSDFSEEKIGVIFAAQFVGSPESGFVGQELPADPHDVGMNFIATELGIHSVIRR